MAGAPAISSSTTRRARVIEVWTCALVDSKSLSGKRSVAGGSPCTQGCCCSLSLHRLEPRCGRAPETTASRCLAGSPWPPNRCVPGRAEPGQVQQKPERRRQQLRAASALSQNNWAHDGGPIEPGLRGTAHFHSVLPLSITRSCGEYESRSDRMS